MKTMWLGLIFFVALALLAVGTVGVGDLPVFGTPLYLEVGFYDVGGLRRGDEVRVNGVKKVGQREGVLFVAVNEASVPCQVGSGDRELNLDVPPSRFPHREAVSDHCQIPGIGKLEPY